MKNLKIKSLSFLNFFEKLEISKNIIFLIDQNCCVLYFNQLANLLYELKDKNFYLENLFLTTDGLELDENLICLIKKGTWKGSVCLNSTKFLEKKITTQLETSIISIDEKEKIILLSGKFSSSDLLIFKEKINLEIKKTSHSSFREILENIDGVVQQKERVDESTKLKAKLESQVENKSLEIKKATEKLQIQETRINQFLKTLELNENQLNLITNSIPMLIAYIEKDLTYSFVNKSYEKWYGKPISEILGYSIEDIVGPSYFVLIKSKIEAVMSGSFVEFVISTQDRINRPKELNVFYLPDLSQSGEVRGFIEITQDITSKKKHEEEKAKLIIRQQTLREIYELKSELLSNFSNEVRTPLNNVLGMIQLLLNSDLNNEQNELAENIRISANLLLNLIDDILDFSKGEAEKLIIESLIFDLVSTFQDLEKIFRGAAESKGLKFSLTVDPKLPLFVNGDPGRIRQVAMNLIGNAIKFTQTGEIQIKLILINESETHAQVECQIQDTGIGIPEKVQSALFQSFSQGEPSRFRKYGGLGLGLGLAISKRLLDLMHGKIGIQSLEVGGTLAWFRLDFPKVLKLPTEDLYVESLIDREKASKFRILVAEDNLINQKVALKILQKMGFQVDAVFNGREAIQKLESTPYDLLLMDCQMPEMDGFEATINIRRDVRLPNHIPIIAMTANAMKGDYEKCLECGMDDYLPKPISEKRLANILNNWMNRLTQAKLKQEKHWLMLEDKVIKPKKGLL